MKTTVFLLMLGAAGLVMLPHAAEGDALQERNKGLVREFYEQAINRKDFASAEKYLGQRYVQHNQRAADGSEGLKAFIQFLRDKYPDARSEIKKVFADGDYVILHVHAVREPGARGAAVVDIFRLENGKIVEHWDVHEDIINDPSNRNGMF